MGLFRTAVGLSGYAALGSAIAYTIWTRKSVVRPVALDDYIFGNTLIARFNPNNAPVFHDICVRKVPLDRIKPELLQPQSLESGKLVERFCAGVWSGAGYSIQRRVLDRQYRGPKTAHQLWDVKDLESSSYDVGTQITDHFQVVSKTPESIIVRAGDSPLREAVRESDGLFEMTAQVNPEERVVEFGLKSVFFNGLGKHDPDGKPPMGSWFGWLHKQYDKILMETAIKYCMK